MLKRLILSLASFAIILVSTGSTAALALVNLSDATINEAVKYGLENQDEGLSSFLGGNWREGVDGSLLNIYTPYIQIARSASRHKMTNRPNAEDIADARSKSIEDISYIWQHPVVKFMVSMYGDTPSFAKNYFAVIEGTGRGRNYTIYPDKTVPQYLADKEKDVTIKPFSAVNAYNFRYEQIAPLDEFTLKLYGKGVEPITFKINSQDIQ